jgi:hypothetical protein
MEVSGPLHAPAASPVGKEPLDGKVGGTHSKSGCGSEEKIPSIQPVAYIVILLTELSQPLPLNC